MSGVVRGSVTGFQPSEKATRGGRSSRTSPADIQTHETSLTLTRHRWTRKDERVSETVTAFVDATGRAELARRLVASLPLGGHTLKRLTVAEYQALESLLDRLMGPATRD